MPKPRVPVNYMPNSGNHRYVINKKTLEHLQDYQKRLANNEAEPGNRLLTEINHFLAAGKTEYDPEKPLTAEAREFLGKLKPADFMQIIMNTRIPTIFAETEATIGNNQMWNKDEYEILGNVCSVIKNVEVYDNGRYGSATAGDGSYKDKPNQITILGIPGAILKWPHTIDGEKILDKVDGKTVINEEKYKNFYKNRLKMILQQANDQALENEKQAFVTVPGIGNGAFAGDFRGKTIGHLKETLKELLAENPQWENIGCVWLDGYDSSVCEDETIGNTKLRVRNTGGQNNNNQLISGKKFSDLGQLSQAADFAESAEEQEAFADCEQFKILAWDHFSYEGNDWVRGSRMTDEAIFAACNALGIISGVEGIYRNRDPASDKPPYAYYPPDGYATWKEFFIKNNLKQSIADSLFVSDNDELYQLQNDREQLIDSIQNESFMMEKQDILIKSRIISESIKANLVVKVQDYQEDNGIHNAMQPIDSIQFEFKTKRERQAFTDIIKRVTGQLVPFVDDEKNGQFVVNVDPVLIKNLDIGQYKQAVEQSQKFHAKHKEIEEISELIKNSMNTATGFTLRVQNYQPGNDAHNDKQAIESVQFEFDKIQNGQDLANTIRKYLPAEAIIFSGGGNEVPYVIQIKPAYLKDLYLAISQSKINKPQPDNTQTNTPLTDKATVPQKTLGQTIQEFINSTNHSETAFYHSLLLNALPATLTSRPFNAEANGLFINATISLRQQYYLDHDKAQKEILGSDHFIQVQKELSSLYGVQLESQTTPLNAQNNEQQQKIPLEQKQDEINRTAQLIAESMGATKGVPASTLSRFIQFEFDFASGMERCKEFLNTVKNCAKFDTELFHTGQVRTNSNENMRLYVAVDPILIQPVYSIISQQNTLQSTRTDTPAQTMPSQTDSLTYTAEAPVSNQTPQTNTPEPCRWTQVRNEADQKEKQINNTKSSSVELQTLVGKIQTRIKELTNRESLTQTEQVKLKALKMLQVDLKNNAYSGFTNFLKNHDEKHQTNGEHISQAEQSKIKAGWISHKTEELFDEADKLCSPAPRR